jgi:hypothetical protein
LQLLLLPVVDSQTAAVVAHRVAAVLVVEGLHVAVLAVRVRQTKVETAATAPRPTRLGGVVLVVGQTPLVVPPQSVETDWLLQLLARR